MSRPRATWLSHLLVLLLAGAAPLCSAAPASSPGKTSAQPAQLAIIIDDLGYNLSMGRRTLDLPGAITVAVLPFTPHGRELAAYAHRRGKEIMLHAPMSNHHQYPLGRGGLRSGMDKHEFLAVLRHNLAEIPYVQGVNNHMGSQLTEQAEPMSWLMAELKHRRLYFVDSRTSAQTQALNQAQAIGLPSLKRDVFLDDKRDQQLIHQQLLRALEKAQQQGLAVAIGHPYPETLRVLEQLPALLDSYQVELVAVSALMPKPTLLDILPTKESRCLAPPMGLWPRVWAPIDPFDSIPPLWEH
ncbi:divergent polysaccharide deacetylase family protein [Cellvibrio fontiphilus]|uniref:Divergent polysaccharide deacetylase family protein n=1 Tax=Cellvibrio fontiphilus TaxID=1815559 RepID=A0ABV7FD19_9GAMM